MSGLGDVEAGASETFDLSVKLRKRLEEKNKEKDRIQSKLNVLTEELGRLFNKLPKKPRETMEQMDKKINDLEYQRTRASLPLAQEKALLRQIDTVKRAKMQLGDSLVHEKKIQEKKTEIGELRDELRFVTAAVAELETALSKVELARRLNVSTLDLETRVVECPKDKLGHVIGKAGGTLKQIEERTGVQVDVDKVGSKVHLHGSAAALEAAVAEVENITLSVEEWIRMDPATVSFLIAKRSEVFRDLQENHPKCYFDLTREKSTLQIRGRPEYVQLAKADVEGISLKRLTRALSDRETGLVVGKGGSTINKITTDHNVVVNVTKDNKSDKAVVEIIGPPNNVDKAMAAVVELLYENEEVEDYCMVQPMQRNKFLSNSGAIVKEIQKKVQEACESNVLLLFEKRSKEEDADVLAGFVQKDPSKLVIKTSRVSLAMAKELVLKYIAEFESQVITHLVSTDIVPSVIGKGGATINQLRKEGSGADIEVDKLTGEIRIQSDSEETRNAVVAAIEKIVQENQVLHVPLPKTMVGTILGEPGKELRKRISEEVGVNLTMDSSDKHLVLRGTNEKNAEAAEIVQEFLLLNFTLEVPLPPEDEATLFQGGAKSVISTIQEDHDVKCSLRKAKNLLLIRGKEENVSAANAAIAKFLHGGDGFAVLKVKVPEAVVGVIIGRGGSGLVKLETDNDGIKVNLQRDTNNLCLRGPADAVKSARATVVTLITTSKITETRLLDAEQHERVSSSDVVKTIQTTIGVQTTLSSNSVKLRGVWADIRDGRSLLEEVVSGTYTSYVDLETSQMARVKSIVEDSLDKVGAATETSLALDEESSVITVSGKRSNVRKAKQQVFGLLEQWLPGEMERVRVIRPIAKLLAEPSCLAQLSASSGAVVLVDRDLSCVVVRSIASSCIKLAMEGIQHELAQVEALNSVLKFDPNDAWLLAILIGKGGVTIQKLEKETNCHLDVSREELYVVISGETKEVVQKGVAAVNVILEQARRERAFVLFSESAMAEFLGKNRLELKKVASAYNVQMDRTKKDPLRLQITGKEAAVAQAYVAVTQWLAEWEGRNAGSLFCVKEEAAAAEIFSPAFLSRLQQVSGCFVEADSQAKTVRVRPNGNVALALEELEAVQRRVVVEEEEEEEARRLKQVEEEERRLKQEAAARLKQEEQAVEENGVHETLAPAPARAKSAAAPAAAPTPTPAPAAPAPAASADHAAAHNLFSLLVSDGSGLADATANGSGGGGGGNAAAAAAGATASSSSSSSSSTGGGDKPYYKSLSGFSIRL